MPTHLFARSSRTGWRRRLLATLSLIMIGALAAACATSGADPASTHPGSAGGLSTTTVKTPGQATTPGEGAVGVNGPASEVPVTSSSQPAASCAQTSAVNAKALLPGAARASAGARTGAVGAEDLAGYATFLATGIAAFTDGPSSTVGWAMGELLGTQGGDVPAALTAQLAQLSNQLDQITSQLNTIEGQLAAITNEIQDSTYLQAIKSLTTDHIAPILSMWQQYCDVVSSGDNNPTTLKQLSSDILDSSTGVRAHLSAIAQTFHGSTLTGDVPLPGMFSQFLSNQNAAGAFDDRPVYQTYISPYTTYFASLAVMGMTIMIEAFHEQGDIPGAEAALKDLWADVREIYQAGGHPISDNAIVTDNKTGTVWARNGICFVAQFDSTDYKQWMNSSDPAQQALAWNTADSSSYVFAKGDSVCSTQWGVLPLGGYLPTMINEAGLPSTDLYNGTGDPVSVWHDPSAKDFQALTAAKGSDTSQTYLNANGFVVPAKGIAGTTALAYDFWQHFNPPGSPGIFDAAKDTYTCQFRALCGGGGWVSLYLVATPQCWLGSADYQGLPTMCGTSWLDTVWAATPPPPAAATPTARDLANQTTTTNR